MINQKSKRLLSTCSRRDYLKATLLLSMVALPLPRARAGDSNTPEPAYSDIEAADRWVTAWNNSKRTVAGALNLTRFADPVYVVTREIKWIPNPTQAATFDAVTVPVGFITDFASIPRVFWSALRPDGDYGYAAIIHDYLYWAQPVTRKRADEIFRFAMEDFHVAAATIAIIYEAVRLGGGAAWNDNAKLKSAGEKRILKRFPEDPTTRWADWKRKSDVF